MISAIVLAAGRSQRMGQSKMMMPWGKTTVIEKVVITLLQSGVTDLHIITGSNRNTIANLLSGLPVNIIFNPDYSDGEMLTSVQVGIKSLPEKSEAVLIALGDQPQVEAVIICQVIESYTSTGSVIVVPSYQMHRGHPWLVARRFYQEIAELKPPSTLREFLNEKHAEIFYTPVNSSSVLEDIDTQSDYQKYKPLPS